MHFARFGEPGGGDGMTALGEWLKQLILIVILAVFADLLLPTKAMQKYVRVVMGVAIIASMLQPILPFFDREWPNKVAESLTQQLTKDNTPSSIVPTTTVDIQRLKETMSDEQAAQASRLIGREVAAMVEGEFNCRVNKVEVSGASEGGSRLHVQVFTEPIGSRQSEQIRAWLAAQLHVQESQITVETGEGRDDSGF
jgi:stage III sporulation protein AF